MPPKAKFTREEIVAVALDIVKSDGLEALTARSLGERLGSSARPIFTVFNSMDEVQEEVVASAREIYNNFVNEGLREELAFKGTGKAYIRYACEYPKLFQLLFMRERTEVPDINAVLGLIDENKDRILNSIIVCYGLSEEVALRLYWHLWIYSHGIAVLIATNVCSFSADEISDMLTEVFVSLLKKIKTEETK